MKIFPRTALLVVFVVVDSAAVDDNRPHTTPQIPDGVVQKDSTAIPRTDEGETQPTSETLAEQARAVSQESIAYLQRLRRNTPFGTADFNLDGLRAGMGSRREPTIKDVRLVRSKIGEIPCEWVLAPGADPDVRLLYLHGGGFVSGSGAYYLPLAAYISATAR